MALTLLLQAGPARAEGPGTGGSRIFISDKTVGNYVLLVWAGPSPPQVGRYTVYVRVSDLAGQQLREGLQVSVRATEDANGAVAESEATHQNAGNSLDYAAHFQLPRKGNYQFDVTVQGAAGDAEAVFRDRVSPGQPPTRSRKGPTQSRTVSVPSTSNAATSTRRRSFTAGSRSSSRSLASSCSRHRDPRR